MLPPPRVVPLRRRERPTPWRSRLFVGSSARGWGFRRKFAAAFLNDSIVREIMTEKYVTGPGAGRSWIDGLPRFSVITKARWEENISRKYHVASSAMVSRMEATLRLSAFDFLAQEIISENARKSNKREVVVYAISRALCWTNIHRRYASRGIGGSSWAP